MRNGPEYPGQGIPPGAGKISILRVAPVNKSIPQRYLAIGKALANELFDRVMRKNTIIFKT